MELIFLGLNMFLVPIKLGTSKFSPYLILILFLVPKKKITYSFSPLLKQSLFNCR